MTEDVKQTPYPVNIVHTIEIELEISNCFAVVGIERSKTAKLIIHKTIPIPPEHIPEGSEFKGYNDFVVQGLEIQPHNIRYRLETYKTPGGKYISGKLPEYLNDKHYNPELASFILYQYFHCHVTQPLLLEQLHEFDIDISKCQLNNILIENKDHFHEEKERILVVGLQVFSYINVDDTSG